MAKTNERIFKLLIMGDPTVGKTSILLRFCDEAFQDSLMATIGVDFKMRTINLDGNTIKLVLWDTAGQERFKSITYSYCRGASGIIFVYDITDKKTFEHINTWIRSAEQHADSSVERILLGNKCDMADKRVVDVQKGEALAEEYGLPFFETSAKENINIEKAIQTLARAIKNRTDANSGDKSSTDSTTRKLGSGSTPNQSGCDC